MSSTRGQPLEEVKRIGGFSDEEISEMSDRGYIRVKMDIRTGDEFVEFLEGEPRSVREVIRKDSTTHQMGIFRLALDDSQNRDNPQEFLINKLSELSESLGVNIARTVLRNQQEFDRSIPDWSITALENQARSVEPEEKSEVLKHNQ